MLDKIILFSLNIYSKLLNKFKEVKFSIKRKFIMIRLYEKESNTKLGIIKKLIIVVFFDLETLIVFFDNVKQKEKGE